MVSRQRLQTGPGFVEMMKSIKTISEDDEDEEDEYVDRSREGRKEGSSQKGMVSMPFVLGASFDVPAKFGEILYIESIKQGAFTDLS